MQIYYLYILNIKIYNLLCKCNKFLYVIKLKDIKFFYLLIII
jgi:hypothetical protein